VLRSTFFLKALANRCSESNAVIHWTRIVREHGPTVYGAAWRILAHAADAEDVFQEVFLEAYRMHQTQTVRNWGGLLRRLAACRSLDRLRQRKRTTSLHDVDVPGPGQEPDAALIEQELSDRLRQAIADLPEREAAVFCLRYFEELPNPRIAEILAISAGAVATALHKARARLECLLTSHV
jgi:RNA polymerase sigma-70 factor (ECF subfamily)